MVNIGTKDKATVVGVPAIIAMLLGLLYMAARPYLNPYIQGDEGAMTSGTIAVYGMLYAIVGGFAVFEVLRQWNAVFEAYKAHDKVKYDENVDKRLPWHLKASWAATSVLLCWSFVLTHWSNGLTASFSVIGVIFVTVFWWRVAMDLDDPFTGIWNIPPIPRDWWNKRK